jgi:hypothetical protein
MIVNEGHVLDGLKRSSPGDAEMLSSYFRGLRLNPVLLRAVEAGDPDGPDYRYDRDVLLPPDRLDDFLNRL